MDNPSPGLCVRGQSQESPRTIIIQRHLSWRINCLDLQPILEREIYLIVNIFQIKFCIVLDKRSFSFSGFSVLFYFQGNPSLQIGAMFEFI